MILRRQGRSSFWWCLVLVLLTAPQTVVAGPRCQAAIKFVKVHFGPVMPLDEADRLFFDESIPLKKRVQALKKYTKRQSFHVVPQKKAIAAQMEIYLKREGDDHHPYVKANAERLYGKASHAVKFKDVLRYFRLHQNQVAEDLTLGSYWRLAPPLKVLTTMAITAAVMAGGSAAYRWSNTVSGNVLSAPSEIHGSDVRLRSFQMSFPGSHLEWEKLQRQAFLNYQQGAREYPKSLNAAKGLWEQYGLNEPFDVADAIVSLTTSLQVNSLTNNFESLRFSEMTLLYQLYFNFPEFFQSPLEAEQRQKPKLLDFISAYDPELEIFEALIESWKNQYNFKWTDPEQSPAEAFLESLQRNP